MKKRILGLALVGVVGLLASVAIAGTPTVSVYFDEALTARALDREDAGLVTLYIVAEGFDADLTAIEYKIDYPVGMSWVSDVDMPQIRIGTTGEGIAQAWPTPINGRSPQVIGKALVRWDPDAASIGDVVVRPNPVSGRIRATAAPDNRVIEAAGGAAQTRSDGTSPLRRSEPILYGGHPTPFNPTTQVTYWIPATTHVRVTAHDVTGQTVTILVDEEQESGDHSVEWNAGGLPSGVYFLRLEAGDFRQNKKVVLLK